MVNIISLRHSDIKLHIESGYEDLSAEISFIDKDNSTSITIDREVAVKLFYKLRYFLEKNWGMFITNSPKKSGEKICLAMQIPKEKLNASSFQEMSNFLNSLTATDVGFYKKCSKMESLFQDTGESSEPTIVSTQING